MANLKFKFDESFDDKIMAVGGWIANDLEWSRLEGAWQRCIDSENERSDPNQQITRFHATEMNCQSGEFANWDKKKRIRLSRKLINRLADRIIGGVAVGCEMEAIQQVWPRGDKTKLKQNTYVVCMKHLMVEIAHILEEYFPGDTVSLIHDHGSWNKQTLAGYNLMVSDIDWKYKELFKGITPMRGSDPSAVGLQAADLLAYEVFKGIKAKTISEDAEVRAVMQTFIDREIPPAGSLDQSEGSTSALPNNERIRQVPPDRRDGPSLIFNLQCHKESFPSLPSQHSFQNRSRQLHTVHNH